MAVTAFNKAKYLIISQELDLLTDDMYILLTSGYTPDIEIMILYLMLVHTKSPVEVMSESCWQEKH